MVDSIVTIVMIAIANNGNLQYMSWTILLPLKWLPLTALDALSEFSCDL